MLNSQMTHNTSVTMRDTGFVTMDHLQETIHCACVQWSHDR